MKTSNGTLGSLGSASFLHTYSWGRNCPMLYRILHDRVGSHPEELRLALSRPLHLLRADMERTWRKVRVAPGTADIAAGRLRARERTFQAWTARARKSGRITTSAAKQTTQTIQSA